MNPGYKFDTISEKIDTVVLGPTPKGWFVGFAMVFAVLQMLLVGLTWLLYGESVSGASMFP